MKTIYYIPITLVIMLISALTFFNVDAFAATTLSRPAVFIVPHQDDELISMGAAISNHVKAGRTVYIVQVTDGAGSSAINIVNSKLAELNKTSRAKYPLLTKQTFSAARDKEQIAALARLGVKPQNIFHESIYNESKIDTDGIYIPDSASGGYVKFLAVIDKYIAKFPTASFKTMSWLDYLSDHYRLGYALNDRCIKKIITDCRFYQSPLYQVGSTHRRVYANGIPVPTVETPIGRFEAAVDKAAVTAAANEYKLWSPAIRRYGIGYASVRTQIDYASAKQASKAHQSSAYWKSSSIKAAADNWIKTYQKPNLK